MGTIIKRNFRLTPESIDNETFFFADLIQENDEESRKSAKKITIVAESVLSIFAKELGEDSICHAIARSRFGKRTIEFNIPGKPVNPFEEKDEILTLSVNGTNIFSRLGVVPEYRYSDGCNNLKFWIPDKTKSGLLSTLLAVVLSFLIGFGLKKFSPDLAMSLHEYVFQPVFTILAHCLTLLSGPLVFLALSTGIIGIGDMNSFKKTGGILILSYMLINVISAIIAMCIALPFVQTEATSVFGKTSSITELINMIVDIFPKDIVTPFATGNTIQIIVLAFAFGLGVLYLGNSVPDLQKLPLQLQNLVSVLLEFFSKFLPLFISLSILSITITTDSDLVRGFYVIFLITTISCVVLEVIHILVLKFRDKISIRKLLKIQMKYAAVAFATASSAAALPLCIESCKEDLGFDSNYVNIGIPLGQLISKPCVISLFIAIAMIFSGKSGVPITTSTILITLIVVIIIAISTPPLPGIVATMIMLLFSQLGIPEENAGLAIGIAMLLDYICTGIRMLIIPQQLMLIAPYFSSNSVSE